MIPVHALQITTVVAVNIVTLLVNLVTEVVILNVLFVLKVSMPNQIPIPPVCKHVQSDIGLIHYLDHVSNVPTHV
jgi:hypothetical protein